MAGFSTGKLSRWLALCACCAAIGSAADASAQGNSQEDQYSEAVPGAENGGTGESQISPKNAKELREQGPDGQAVEALVEGTSPTGSGASGGEGSTAGDDTSAVGKDGSVSGALTDAAGGSEDGLGIVLPLVIVVVVAGGVAFLVMRRRRAARP